MCTQCKIATYFSKDCHLHTAHRQTRVRTHIHTHTQTLAQMPHRRSASQTRPLSLCCCQIKPWKAGHKGECVAAARADTRTKAKPTADQMRVSKMLEQLVGAADWRGVAAQGRSRRADFDAGLCFVCLQHPGHRV